MNRRDFLKYSGLLSTAMLLQFNPIGKLAGLPVETEAGGKTYRGTRDGSIYVSENAGQTWQMHTDFGSEFSVLDLSAVGHDTVQAQIGFGGYSFQLRLSPESKAWRTV